jgi:hypothetical protein
MIKTKDDHKKKSMKMDFIRLVELKNESVKIQRVSNLLRFYSITFLFVLYVSQLYSLDCSNYRLWPNRL